MPESRAKLNRTAGGKNAPLIRTVAEDLSYHVELLREPYAFLPQFKTPKSYADRLSRLGVTDGLSPEQKARLSELVAEFCARGSHVTEIGWLKRDRKSWVRNGLDRLRVLEKKMEKARTAIRMVRAYLDKFDMTPTVRGDPLNKSDVVLSDEVLQRAEAVLDPAGLAESEAIIKSLRTAPSDDAMLALFEFFTFECKLAKPEAEVRVGTIGNDYWAWNLTVIRQPKRRTDERKGCEVIRKAVARRRA
jgi:hypothetical protein